MPVTFLDFWAALFCPGVNSVLNAKPERNDDAMIKTNRVVFFILKNFCSRKIGWKLAVCITLSYHFWTAGSNYYFSVIWF
jgi:hypothetical protein